MRHISNPHFSMNSCIKEGVTDALLELRKLAQFDKARVFAKKTLRSPIISAEFWRSVTSFLMPKQQVRSPSCPDKPNLKRNRQKSMEDMTTIEGREIEENFSLKIIMDKLKAMEARIEDNFSQGHSQIDGVKESIKDIEKSLENAWAAIEDVQQEPKAHKDSKRSSQEMLDKQTNLIPTATVRSEKCSLRKRQTATVVKRDSRKIDRFGKLYKERELKSHCQ